MHYQSPTHTLPPPPFLLTPAGALAAEDDQPATAAAAAISAADSAAAAANAIDKGKPHSGSRGRRLAKEGARARTTYDGARELTAGGPLPI